MAQRTKSSHHEFHNLGRRGWIRAGVLGANDGVVSIAALVMALLAGKVSSSTLMLTSLSALVAGACSMAIGEYVSVASQSDIEHTDIAKEKRELKEDPDDELAELAGIYRNRGISEELAMKVALELTEHDALQAHLRDELGIVEDDRARPLQASYVSFIAFSIGGLLPFVSSVIVYHILDGRRFAQLMVVATITLVALYILGFLGAKLGGAPVRRAVTRVIAGGVLALLVTSFLGAAFA